VIIGLVDIIISVGGLVAGLISKSMDMSHERYLMLSNSQDKDRRHARSASNQWMAWTRRFIAVMATSFIFLAPVLAMFFGYPTWVSFEETNGWLPAFLSGDVDIVWKSLPEGLVITPLHQYSFEAIVSFYFGKSRN